MRKVLSEIEILQLSILLKCVLSTGKREIIYSHDDVWDTVALQKTKSMDAPTENIVNTFIQHSANILSKERFVLSKTVPSCTWREQKSMIPTKNRAREMLQILQQK